MIKKITLIMIFCFMIISCGKKGDPEYKDPQKKSDIQNVIINKV
jgi:hypothetical protein